MAAPETVDITDLSGVWVLNRTLSDDTDDALAAQSIGWVLRRAFGVATITATITHYKHPETGVEHIDTNQSLSGITNTTENRTLDWTDRPREDYVFGKVVGKSRRIKLEDVEDEKLKEGWTEDTIAKDIVQSYVVNDEYKWQADQVWGFMIINGERRHARRFKLTTPTQRLDKLLVFDYFSPLKQESQE